MATYTGNVLRLGAPQDPRIAPGGPDVSHDQPSGPDAVPEYRAEQITVPADMGAEYAGLTMDDGISAVVAGQPGLGWNAPNTAIVPPGSGATPAGFSPAWTAGDPHNAEVDTSFASARHGSLPGSPYRADVAHVHSTGDDTLPYRLATQIGVAGSSFLERLADFPRLPWVDPSGGNGVDKFINGTNSYAASNPEGDQYATGRGGGRVYFGFESPYFVHQPLFIDKPAQFYERPTTPITARDPLVGGAYTNTPVMGQLAANTWLTELGESVVPTGYGVPVDGVM